MQYINGLEAYCSASPCAVALGKFDGLHRGHEKLIWTVREISRAEGLESVVCVFDMSSTGSFLMTGEERKARLDGRVDWLVNCPFTDTFRHMEAEDFIRKVLVGLFHAACVVVGPDFQFGYRKKGDVRMLEAYAEAFGYRLIVIEKERYGEREISSTYIREAVREGDMKLAAALLGYPYTISGIVEHGRQLGRTLGFPTLNVHPPHGKLMPPNGVYMERVRMDGNWYPAVGNVGIKPTVEIGRRVLVESFLLDYQGNAYGKKIQMELLEFRRPEQRFHDVGEMRDCVHRDIRAGREYFRRNK